MAHEVDTQFQTCLEKQKQIIDLFSLCATQEEKYQKIISLGRALPPLDPSFHTEQNIVQGCQSTLYLHSSLKNDLIYFEAATDALISKGLASLLIHVYSGEHPLSILKCPPSFLEQLDIYGSLSPGRSNGLLSMYRRMKQDALKFFIELSKN